MGGSRPCTRGDACSTTSPAAGTASSSTSAHDVADRWWPGAGGGAIEVLPASAILAASCIGMSTAIIQQITPISKNSMK